MLTEPIFSGMNILSLAGFLLMGIGLTFTRQRKVPASSVKNGQPIDLGG
jgi:LPXTG-motif cell wall-anchored protein